MRTEKVWWQMLAKDKERQGQREQRGRQEGTNRKTGRGRGGRGGQAGKGDTDGGSQRTSCFVAKTDHFTSFGIVCTGLLDFAALKSYDISTQITCV